MCNNTREREASIDLPSLGRRRGGGRGSLAPKEGLSFSRSGTLELFSFTALDSFGFGGVCLLSLWWKGGGGLFCKKKVCSGGGSCGEIYI